jgi:repressor LexA
MTYAELLKQYIKESRYTLEEISNLLLDRGLSASREHLSRLRNGKVPPASDDLNKALAEITGGDPEKLLLFAHAEKAPLKFKDKLYTAVDFLFPGVGPLTTNYEDYLQTIGRGTGLLTGEYSGKDFEKITPSAVPVLGHIAAGAPILAEEHIVSYMDIPHPDKCSLDELFVLIVRGDSMEGSRIYDGDKVVVKIQPEVENGEIAAVNVDGDNATLKKIKKYEDGSVWLISTNEKYAPIPLTHERARIIGKVIQVIFEP